MAEPEYVITHHAQERYLERFKYKYVSDRELPYLVQEAFKNRRLLKQEIINKLESASEERWFLNNHEFMQKYYDKYGYDGRFQFLVDDDLVFVIVIDEGKHHVVTCVPANRHKISAGRKRVKFKKKQHA